MTTAVETIRDFYAALASGDAPRALGLIPERYRMDHHVALQSRRAGSQQVAEGLLVPLMKEWKSFKLIPTEFIADGGTVVSLGRFVGVHGTTGKMADAKYAHV